MLGKWWLKEKEYHFKTYEEAAQFHDGRDIW